jgi:hypothetical protein
MRGRISATEWQSQFHGLYARVPQAEVLQTTLIDLVVRLETIVQIGSTTTRFTPIMLADGILPQAHSKFVVSLDLVWPTPRHENLRSKNFGQVEYMSQYWYLELETLLR